MTSGTVLPGPTFILDGMRPASSVAWRDPAAVAVVSERVAPEAVASCSGCGAPLDTACDENCAVRDRDIKPGNSPMPLESSPVVVRTPGVMGGAACIVGTRVDVFSLVSLRRAGWSVGQMHEDAYPHLTLGTIFGALAWADEHPSEIARDERDSGREFTAALASLPVEPEAVSLADTRLVLVESPFAGDVAANVAYARACLADCLARGEAPFASHLLYTQHGVLCDDVPAERQQGISAGLAWGDRADATVVYTDRGVSRGMLQGIARAEAAGRPVERRTVPGWENPAPAVPPVAVERDGEAWAVVLQASRESFVVVYRAGDERDAEAVASAARDIVEHIVSRGDQRARDIEAAARALVDALEESDPAATDRSVAAHLRLRAALGEP